MKDREVRILGVRIDNLTPDEALQQMEDFIHRGTPHLVVTPNPEFLVMAQENPQFRAALERADLALADGVGLTLAARLLGTPLKERLPGVDMVRSLAQRAAQQGYGLFLLGGAPGIAQKAAQRLQQEFPGLRVVGTYAGSPTAEEEAKIVDRVRSAAPQILLVAYGAPHQELWLQCTLDRLGVPLAMGVGGALDYLSGAVPRAPRWMQRLGLEWLFRLIRQPWRWRRMVRLPRFVVLILMSFLTSGRKS